MIMLPKRLRPVRLVRSVASMVSAMTAAGGGNPRMIMTILRISAIATTSSVTMTQMRRMG